MSLLSEFESLKRFLKNSDIEYKEFWKISEFSPMKIGGIARIVAEPQSINALIAVSKYLYEKKIPFIVVGRMSNILASDDPYEGVIVRCTRIRGYEYFDGCLHTECGFSFSSTARHLAKLEVGGFEPLAGIPGCIGGMITMNAGAYGTEISDIVRSINVYDLKKGNVVELSALDMDFGYRKSNVKSAGYIVLSTRLNAIKRCEDQIVNNLCRTAKMRRNKQPLEYPNLGSAFKRPQHGYAGAMIEACGLKGYRIGGAQISGKHAGFIINRGEATAEDVKQLIVLVQRLVKDKFGVFLDTEFEIL